LLLIQNSYLTKAQVFRVQDEQFVTWFKTQVIIIVVIYFWVLTQEREKEKEKNDQKINQKKTKNIYTSEKRT
jgi:preprotein translocase subunit YajC